MGKFRMSVKSGTVALALTLIVGTVVVMSGSMMSVSINSLANIQSTQNQAVPLVGSVTNAKFSLAQPAAQAAVTDTTRPNGKVIVPTANAIVHNTITVTVHATDNVAPTKVVFYLDPGSVKPVFGTSTTNSNGDFSVQFDTTKAPNGAHNLAAITYDAAGNNRGSSSTPITIDNQTVTDPTSPFNLDDTGKTIPDTNYAIPADAIFMATTGNDSNDGTQTAPVKTLNAAIDMAPAGGTIVVRGGVYRDTYHQPNKPYYYKIISKKLTYQAYPHEQAWFDGTDAQATDSWTSDGIGHWYKAWDTPQFCNGAYYDFLYGNQSKSPNNLTSASGKTYASNTGPCAHWDVNSAPEFPSATDPQLAYIDGQRQDEVASLSGTTSGKFYYDQVNKRIYIATNPSGHTVELATRPSALVIGASGTQIKGLGFRRYATNEYSNLTNSAVYMGGTDFLVQDAVFTENAAGGLSMAPQGSTMNHVTSVNNGFSSSGGNGHSEGGLADNVQILNNLISNNNTEHFDLHCSISCGQAGMKMAHMQGFTVKNNIFKNNEGSGFWCDENCTGAVIVKNLFMNNTSSGVFYEVSSDGIIASNLLINNGPAGYGIRVGSATTKVYNNTIITNKAYGGIWVYDDSRNAGDTRGSKIGPNTTGVDVVNNVTYNNVGTVSSLSANGGTIGGGNTQPDQFFNTIDYNAYYRQNGTSSYALVRWQPKGIAETRWKTDAAFYAAKGFDQHGIDVTSGGDPFFVDLINGNYTLRADSAAYQSGTALPSDVASAIGVSPAAGQNRGAFTWPGKQ